MRKRRKLRLTGDLYNALLNYAFRLLSRRDYSESELLKKLEVRVKLLEISATVASEAIPKVFARLKDLRYLDDQKFAKRFLESRAAISPRGKFFLKFEMKNKGIPEAIFEKLWEEGGYSEEDLARKLLEQKRRLFSRFSKESQKKKAFSLLSSHGFSLDTIYSIMDGL